MLKPIGIFGGTFDPIHVGHLRTAIELLEVIDFKEIRFIPCCEPVHKNKPVASPADRLTMVKIATDDTAQFIADDLEIVRGGSSYMIDTLIDLRKKFPQDPLCLIVGMDAFAHFHTWHRYEEILMLCHIVVADRPRAAPIKTEAASELQTQYEVYDPFLLHQTMNGRIFKVPVTQLDISASKIRQIFRQDLNAKYLIPLKVGEYIQQHGVYTSAEL